MQILVLATPHNFIFFFPQASRLQWKLEEEDKAIWKEEIFFFVNREVLLLSVFKTTDL